MTENFIFLAGICMCLGEVPGSLWDRSQQASRIFLFPENYETETRVPDINNGLCGTRYYKFKTIDSVWKWEWTKNELFCKFGRFLRTWSYGGTWLQQSSSASHLLQTNGLDTVETVLGSGQDVGSMTLPHVFHLVDVTLQIHWTLLLHAAKWCFNWEFVSRSIYKILHL